MPNDQYQIPERYNETEIRAQIDAIHVDVKPEIAPAPYEYIKAIEAEIYALREQALSRQKKSKKWLKGLDIVLTPQAPTLHELIEQESVYGGKLFGGSSKFWLDEKQPKQFHGEGDEWFFQQGASTDASTNAPIILRFQTTGHQIHKLYNGLEYPMTEEDVQSFTTAAQLYKSAIAPLYPQNDTV